MSAAVDAPERLFAFVAPEHPFTPALDALRAQAGDAPAPPSGAVRTEVTAEIKGVRTPDGWRLDRFSHCTAAWGGPGDVPFAARTLYWRDGCGPATWSALPDEPYLEGLAAVLAPRDGEPVEVLRYVPLRRFTWRSGGVIAKAKRRSRLADSYARARAVTAAAADGTRVQVPALRGTTDVPAAYRQDAVAGPALAELAREDDLLPLLAEAGSVHARFGELPAVDLPLQAPDAGLPAVLHAADWVGALLPELRASMRHACAVLRAHVPEPDARALATCHGDLVPSHLIGGPGRWSVIDLDLAHRGDRHRDLAVFLSGLPTDVPALSGEGASPALLAAAEQAYLDGYAARWGRAPEPARLAWFRAAEQIRALALAVSKDRLRPGTVGSASAVLDRVLPEVAGR